MNPNHSNKSLSNMERVATIDDSPPQPPSISDIFQSPEAILVVATAFAITIVIHAIAKSIAIVIDSWHKRK